VLKQAGVPFDSVKLVNLSPPAMQAAWDTKNINMFETWQPVFGYAQSHGGHILFTNSLVSDVAPSPNYDVVNTTWAKQHPDLVKGFVQAMNAGVVYADAHTDEALTMMTKFGGISLDEGRIEYAGYETFDLNQQLTPTVLGLGPTTATAGAVNGFVAAATFLLATGNIASAPSRAEFAAHVDPSFVQQVAAASS
jgi:ABC-type nitrate/sulfonate/bicarbonate transport system substrate-binding protein